MTRQRHGIPVVARPVPPRSPRRGAFRIVAVVVASLLLGALLNAQHLLHTAEIQPAGWRRTVALAAAEPLAQLSQATGLDRPRAWLDDLLRPDGPAPTPPASPTPSPSPSVEPTPSPIPSPTVPQTPDPTIEPTPAPPQPVRWVATADDPAVAWVTGDSLTESFGPGLV